MFNHHAVGSVDTFALAFESKNPDADAHPTTVLNAVHEWWRRNHGDVIAIDLDEFDDVLLRRFGLHLLDALADSGVIAAEHRPGPGPDAVRWIGYHDPAAAFGRELFGREIHPSEREYVDEVYAELSGWCANAEFYDDGDDGGFSGGAGRIDAEIREKTGVPAAFSAAVRAGVVEKGERAGRWFWAGDVAPVAVQGGRDRG